MMKSILAFLCVASTVFGANGLYRDAAKGVVVDGRTGLVWQDDAAAASTTATWANAITTCEALSLGGYTDWRLPNVNELKSIRDMSRSNPAIEATFVNTASNDYWSSTSYAADSTDAWGVGFYSGNVYWDGKTNSDYVRCVRGQ